MSLTMSYIVSGVYRITNKDTGLSYLGSSKNIRQRLKSHIMKLRMGTHSCAQFQKGFDASEESRFELTIVEYCDTDILLERELYYLTDMSKLGLLYNTRMCASGGDMITHHPDRLSIIQRITDSIHESIASMSIAERRAKWGRPGALNGMFGKTHTPETRAFLSKINKGNTNCVGYKHTDEFRKKISDRQKLRVGVKNSFYGKTHTPETRAKISAARKGRVCPTAKAISVDGVYYTSATAAGKVLSINPGTIRHRVLSPNPKYVSYFYVD